MRVDVMFALKECSRHLEQPYPTHLDALKRIVGYLGQTAHLVLELRVTDPSQLVGYADANWAGCVQTRKSTGCGLVLGVQCWCMFMPGFWDQWHGVSVKRHGMLAVPLVRRCSTSQAVVLDAGMEALALVLSGDASMACPLAQRQGLSKVRHLAVPFLWLQDLVSIEAVTVVKVSSRDNPADLGTKHFSAEHTRTHSRKVRLTTEEDQKMP
eukprot:3053953-Amphidinium_carterae.1